MSPAARNERQGQAQDAADDAPERGRPAPYDKPRVRQRRHKSPEVLDVPDIDVDAAERKRVLNVLAQRRYRERRRQDKSGTSVAPQSAPAASTSRATDRHAAGASRSLATPPEESVPLPVTLSGISISPSMAFSSLAFGLDLDSSSLDASALDASFDGMVPAPPWTLGTTADPGAASILATDAFDPLLSFGTDGRVLIGGGTLAASSSSSHSSPYSAADHLSPDSYYLPVSELTLLRAVMRIATRLGCVSSLWQLDGQSPFHAASQSSDSVANNGGGGGGSGSSSSSSSSPHNNATDALALLPTNWRPTRAQRMIPHHPILDVLPWPAVRERLIGIFSLPFEVRPLTAADPLALIQFVYDLEDGAEGLRVWGSDPYDASCWEIGQLVFERWWFVFDREVVDQSNRWREMRGASKLHQARMGAADGGSLGVLWAA